VYVCLCNGVTDRQVRAKASSEECSVGAVHRALGITPKCGKCIPMMRDLVRECSSEAGAEAGV
jgi:bacterioferritin-associated ferredoxin